MGFFGPLWLFGIGLSLIEAPELVNRFGVFLCGVAAGGFLVSERRRAMNKAKGL